MTTTKVPTVPAMIILFEADPDGGAAADDCIPLTLGTA